MGQFKVPFSVILAINSKQKSRTERLPGITTAELQDPGYGPILVFTQIKSKCLSSVIFWKPPG
jgi:hypothetical protein